MFKWAQNLPDTLDNFVWGIRKKWSHADLLTPPDSKMGGAYRKRLLILFDSLGCIKVI